jgi:molecular chaperone DnaK
MAAVGIDLGTTFSAVAAINAAGHPTVLANADGETMTPSVVCFDGERPVVGRAAKLAAAAAPLECVELVKRHIGEPAWRFETALGTPYTAEQISALILRQLARDAAVALGHAVQEAVITVPAYFDDARRRATADAGRIAGLDVLRVLNEPTAAALAFGYASGRDETLLVYDLGGGTFDVTVVRVTEGVCEVLATDGDRNLGGFDFDNALMLHVAERVRAAGGPDLLDGELGEATLRDRCEQAKRTLSSLPEASVTTRHGGALYTVDITRPAFERLTAPLLRRTEDIMRDVLADAGAVLGGALLVGGSTRMPRVAAMVEHVTGVRTDRSVHPDQAVALGAAVQAAALSRTPRQAGGPLVTVLDVTSQSLGIAVRSAETGAEQNSVVIPRNTSIPCQALRRYRTLAENQREIFIEVTEGDDADMRFVTVVGSARIAIPPRPGSLTIDLVMSYDEDGMIGVGLVEADTGKPLGDFGIDRRANLDAREVDRMRAALRALG